MAILNNNPLVGASGNQGGYNINNSLRFRRSASAYLTRTPASSGSQTTWTYSTWFKRGALGSDQILITAGSTNNDTNCYITSSDKIYWFNRAGGAMNGIKETTQVFRDPSAWYHIMLVWDTTQGTASNRMKIYVNGSQVTAFSSSTDPSLNTTSFWNSNVSNNIASDVSLGSNTLDGYLAEINFVNAQALTPSSFGETDAITGVWKPKAYTGTYGTNGFYLKFSDIATTSGSNAGLGKDFSGNSNYWTTNNISVTAGTTYDAMTDSPTNTSATVANYPTWNPLKLYTSSTLTLSNANLTASDTTSNISTRIATMSLPTTGKWYWEVTVTAVSAANGFVGAIDAATANGNSAIQAKGAYRSNGDIENLAGTAQTAGASYTSGDIIGVAVDVDAGTVKFYKNNAGQGGTPSFSFTAGTELFPFVATDNNAGTKTFDANFGQRPFAYTPPTGFNRLNTYNIPTPTILQGNKYMDATLATGVTGGTQVITNAGAFKPDFIWSKQRDSANDNFLVDSVRGASKYLISNNSSAEATATQFVTSFNSNGFTFGTSGYISGQTSVNWQWQAGQGSTSSNTSGSITSTVSVNTTAGFSIVTYTGTGSAGTVGHGLGVTPSMVIVKNRTTTGSASGYWMVKHSSMSSNNNCTLNTTDAQFTPSQGYIGNLSSSTTFSLTAGGSGILNVSPNGATMVAYCWAEIAGFSKFGSYTGNGSADGPFVYTGFRPKFILFKVTSEANGWVIYDTSRDTYNYMGSQLYPNLSNAEAVSSSYAIDATANGFKIRTSNGVINVSSGTFIYAAFAENPTKFALAR